MILSQVPGRHPEISSNDQLRCPALARQRLHQVENPPLNGHDETRGRVIGNQQFGAVHQRRSNAAPSRRSIHADRLFHTNQPQQLDHRYRTSLEHGIVSAPCRLEHTPEPKSRRRRLRAGDPIGPGPNAGYSRSR